MSSDVAHHEVPMRSALFVPANRDGWIRKALLSGADGIIIDLEDSIPEESKEEARIKLGTLERVPGVAVFVRVNALDTPHFALDVYAAVEAGVDGLVLPKIYSRDDVVRFDSVITAAEIEKGSGIGTHCVMVSIETSLAVVNSSDIMGGPRVTGVLGAAARDADISREIGFQWSPEGLETLYIRGKIVAEARAAGLIDIMVGLWQEIDDLDGLRKFAAQNRGLGFTGQVIIHPGHVEVVNEAFGLSHLEVARLERMHEAFMEASAGGYGSVVFEGEHIDRAHAIQAKLRLDAHRIQKNNIRGGEGSA